MNRPIAIGAMMLGAGIVVAANYNPGPMAPPSDLSGVKWLQITYDSCASRADAGCVAGAQVRGSACARDSVSGIEDCGEASTVMAYDTGPVRTICNQFVTAWKAAKGRY